MTTGGRGLGRRERIIPWVALFLPAVAWMTYEYGASAALRGGCASVGGWLGPAWGAGAMLSCVLAVRIAWPLARGAAGAEPPVRPWLARIACFASSVFALAIAFQTLATLIVPSCAR